MKAVLKLAKFLVLLASELTKPETWSKMGAGMAGAGLGQMLVTGNVLSLIGVVIGTAMTIGGITVSSLKAALKAENGTRAHAVKEHLLATAQELPEAFCTGLCMGLIVGAIQRAVTPAKTQATSSRSLPQSRPGPQRIQLNASNPAPIAKSDPAGINFDDFIKKLNDVTAGAKENLPPIQPLRPLTAEEILGLKATMAKLETYSQMTQKVVQDMNTGFITVTRFSQIEQLAARLVETGMTYEEAFAAAKATVLQSMLKG